MAFQKTLSDIPTQIPQTQAPTVDTTTAQLIQGAGALAGETVKNVQKQKARADIQETADVVTAVTNAAQQQGLGETGDVNLEGLSPDLQQQIARVQATAGDKFKRIANAVSQGAIPQAAAALETEATVRELMNQTPGFGQEIRQVARELTGFDPTGFALRQILNIPKAGGSKKLSAQEKRTAAAKVTQSGLANAGIEVSLDTVLGNMAVEEFNTTRQSVADSQLALNSINVRQWAQQSYVERGVDLSSTLVAIGQLGAEGGITSTQQYVNAVVQQREAHKAEFRKQVALRGGMETAGARAIESQIDGLYEPLITSVKDNEAGKFFQEKLDLNAKIYQVWAAEATPRLTRIIGAYGPQIGGQLLEMMSNIADPAQFELIYKFEPGLKELVENGAISQKGVAEGVDRTVSKVLNGEKLSPDDLQFRRMAETQVTQPGRVAIREDYIRGLGETGSPVRGVSIMAAKVPRAQATTKEVKFIKDQYALHIGTVATEGVPGNLVDAVAREIISLEDSASNVGEVKMVTDSDGRTKLVIKASLSGFDEPREFQTDQMKRMQSFLDAATQAGYATDFGVDGGMFPLTMMNRVRDRIDLLKKGDNTTGEVQR